MKWIFHEHEGQVIYQYSLRTDRQSVVYWATNHLGKKQQKGKCIPQMLPVFCHYMETPPRILTIVVIFTCIS